MRRARSRLLVVGFVLLSVGWGASGGAHSVTSTRTPSTAAGRCASPAHLGAGVAVSSWRLSAVHFLSPKLGVALSASRLPCYVPARSGGVEVQWQRQPVRLAVSNDGGQQWITRGGSLPAALGSIGAELVARSAGDVWAISGAGKAWRTVDGGDGWTAEPVPTPVVQLALRGDTLWALACRRTGRFSCRPVLDHMRLPDGPWVRAPLPRVNSEQQPAPRLAVPSGQTIVIQTGSPKALAGKLLISTSDGRRWSVRAEPAWADGPCSGALLATASASDWWLLCNGSGAAGSSTKALFRTTDGGRAWTTVSAVANLAVPYRPGSLPYGEPAALAAGSSTELWLAGYNGLNESADAGATWRAVAGVNQGGWPTSFDVLSANRAWLLAVGMGLWRTTNGSVWQPDV